MASPSSVILAQMQPLLAELASDLLERARDPHVGRALHATWRQEQEEQRTADTFEVWSRERVRQVAAAWVLSVIFVRTLEDRDLVERRRIAGPGAEDSEQLFVQLAPHLTARDYLFTVFRELSRLEGARAVFEPAHNPAWLLGPSDQAARRLIDAFRRTDGSGELLLRFDGSDTRFLGDLYQDLDAEARDRFALLQTPDFIESFILDGTLTPAIKELGVDKVTLIDPAAGSGHFVLGAFGRLLAAWREAKPAEDARSLALRALAQVHGVDINPFAVAIARFRLTLAFMEAAGYQRLRQVPPLPLRLVVADTLIKQPRFTVVRGADGPSFVLDDQREATQVLRGGSYSVVVGNPPYINVKDAALRERYRREYVSCHRGYQLVAPFLERFFELAAPNGWIGAIVGNGFMKREFGTKLVEQVLPKIELTEVVDTQGAYIPGHGTPTVILFGRNRQPAKTPVLTAMGKRGEPSTPLDPAQGRVWSSIRDHHREIGYEDEYISVADVERERLAKHPWSLGGGGAAELRERLEKDAARRLADMIADVGRTLHSGEDSAFFLPEHVATRLTSDRSRFAPLVKGEQVRDWLISSDEVALFPYDLSSLVAMLSRWSQEFTHYWRLKAVLRNRRDFEQTIEERGLRWFEYSMFFRERFRTPLSIGLAEIATHNHFVLDRGGKLFKQTAPVIKLMDGGTEEDHLTLLGYLNSSTACFWMKQVMMNKGVTSDSGVLQADPERFRFVFDSSKLARLPIPRLQGPQGQSLLELARALDQGGRLLAPSVFRETVETHATEGAASLRSRLALMEKEREGLRASMVAWQEELDWLVYEIAGLIPLSSPARSRALSSTPEAIHGIDPDQRPYRLVDTLPAPPLPPIEQARLDLIATSRELGLIERPENKRRWFRSQGKFDAENVSDEMLRHDALRSWLLDLLERAAKASGAESAPTAVRTLSAALEHDPAVIAVAELYAGDASPNLDRLFTNLIGEESVPYLAAYRYADSGIEKRAAWESTWELQRREDAGEKVKVPVPPKYTQADFRAGVYWRHRGKLDVPKERFVSYPGAEADEDPSPLLGWAGWDHLEQAQALTALYRRRLEEGWERDRLLPLLAGLAELLPWLKQWHNQPDARWGGARAGESYAAFLAGELRKLGITESDLKAWRPAAGATARRRPSIPAEHGTRTRGRPDALDEAGLLAAVAELEGGDGVEQRTLAEALGVSGQVVARLADRLIATGRLVLTGGRPKKFRIAEEA